MTGTPGEQQRMGEARLLARAVTVHQLSGPELDTLLDRWTIDRRPRESLVGFLLRVGWLRPDGEPAAVEGAELFTSRMFDRITAEVGGRVHAADRPHPCG